MNRSWLRQHDTGPEIAEPKVTVLAYTKLTLEAETSFALKNACFTGFEKLERLDDGEYLVEYAGRNCYQSWSNPAGRTTEGYIKNIVKQKHFSVLEHTNVTFDIEGVSRAFTHELIRHRHLSYSQLSQRYVDESKTSFICPSLLLSDPTLVQQWYDIVSRQLEDYKTLYNAISKRHPSIKRKEKREAARSVLPNATSTQIVVTGNLRAWREFLDKRWNSHADPEIRSVAAIIRTKLMDLYPAVFEDVAYS